MRILSLKINIFLKVNFSTKRKFSDKLKFKKGARLPPSPPSLLLFSCDCCAIGLPSTSESCPSLQWPQCSCTLYTPAALSPQPSSWHLSVPTFPLQASAIVTSHIRWLWVVATSGLLSRATIFECLAFPG